MKQHFALQLQHNLPLTEEGVVVNVDARKSLLHNISEVDAYFRSKIGQKFVYFVGATKLSLADNLYILRVWEDEIENLQEKFVFDRMIGENQLMPRLQATFSCSIKKMYKNDIMNITAFT